MKHELTPLELEVQLQKLAAAQKAIQIELGIINKFSEGCNLSEAYLLKSKLLKFNNYLKC